MRDAVILMILGMGTVMILLFLINLMIVLIGKLFAPREGKKSKNPKHGGSAPSPTAANQAISAEHPVEEEALIAILAAAAAAYLNTSPDRVHLVVRPIQTSTAWASTGRLESNLF